MNKIAPPTLDGLVGSEIMLYAPALALDKKSFKARLHGVEQSGLWLERDDINKELSHRCDDKINFSAFPLRPVFFCPFQHIP